MSEETRSKLICICVGILCVIAILGLVFWATPSSKDVELQSGDPGDVLVSTDGVKDYESPDDVPLYDVLVVGDKTYTSRDLVERTNSLLKRSGINKTVLGADYAKYKIDVLNYWASELALPLIAEKNGLTVSDEEFNAAKDTVIMNYGGADVFKAALTDVGETEEAFDSTLKLNLLSSKVAETANLDVSVSDEEIQAYYEENKDVMVTAAHCDVYLIQCETEEQLNTAKQRLDAGESWDTVAAELNKAIDENSSITNGHMGNLIWDELDTVVTEAIIKAGWGKHTDIVTLGGDGDSIKAILKGENFEESRKILLEDAKEDIRQILSEEKMSTKFIEYIESQYEGLGVKILVTEADIAKKEAK